MKGSISRRDFLILTAKGAGAAVVSYGLMGCATDDDDKQTKNSISFNHGIASGDPLTDAIILWTRITPSSDGEITVSWEIAIDQAFTQLVNTGNTTTSAARDYTIKVDAIGLSASTTYYYRFISNGTTSSIGTTKTLPDGSPDSVKLAVLSCANYPAGFFNVYNLAAQQDDLDAILHLGDYIYEYGRGEYGSDNAETLDRQVLPTTEIFSLSDYRTRYAQYHSDPDLQLLHSKVPFITVWDDHEVADDTWSEGAANHNEDEGSFEDRKLAALQAYFEWLPIRPWSEGNYAEIYRQFSFGDLVDLYMLDTRVLAREKQLDYADYFDGSVLFDEATFNQDLYETERTMLGAEQLQWLNDSVSVNNGRWQLLGQQVLMGAMKLPGAVALNAMSTTDYAELGTLALLAGRIKAGDSTITADEQTYYEANADKLTADALSLLSFPELPYNLDAWDGYATERDKILAIFNDASKNLVVVAGDTHNAWANELSNSDDKVVGVEFATASISSPGLEYYLSISDDAIESTEDGFVSLIEGLKYSNAKDRGFLTLTFTQEKVKSQWHYVDTILSSEYTELTDRRKVATSNVDQPSLTFS
ncbi:alkaline phosphatase D family protein [Psychromonas sp. SA13A]|uniref:alkaline phosphatase D family protein n=1 Tax=Psychromonas sp. SA13A TaxID=2686346 RepID=UPI00140A4E28|nr:alkaline phosphatase D family protein [Psychromonas sp. SA13A]